MNKTEALPSINSQSFKAEASVNEAWPAHVGRSKSSEDSH